MANIILLLLIAFNGWSDLHSLPFPQEKSASYLNILKLPQAPYC